MESFERAFRLFSEIHSLHPKLHCIDLVVFSDLCRHQPTVPIRIADRAKTYLSKVNGIISKLLDAGFIAKNGHGVVITKKGRALQERIIYSLSEHQPKGAIHGICPACIKNRKLTRHHYLPQCEFGNGNPHVVLLCEECHPELEVIIKKRKPRTSLECLRITFAFIHEKLATAENVN